MTEPIKNYFFIILYHTPVFIKFFNTRVLINKIIIQFTGDNFLEQRHKVHIRNQKQIKILFLQLLFNWLIHKFKYLLFTSKHEIINDVDDDDDSLQRFTGTSLVAIAGGLIEALSPNIESMTYSI